MSELSWIGEFVTWLVLAGVLLWLAKLERMQGADRTEQRNGWWEHATTASLHNARLEALEASAKADRQARTTELAAKTHLARVPVVRTFTVGARGDAEERQADGRGPEVLP